MDHYLLSVWSMFNGQIVAPHTVHSNTLFSRETNYSRRQNSESAGRKSFRYNESFPSPKNNLNITESDLILLKVITDITQRYILETPRNLHLLQGRHQRWPSPHASGLAKLQLLTSESHHDKHTSPPRKRPPRDISV
jgi:hypothetical protein